ncbi:MAG: hypothetical protein GEU78_04490 [Actinobacteria bacterium]|nr:hypothetical protein [Actinomycetota bacterium]
MRIPFTLRSLAAASLVIALFFLATRPRTVESTPIRWVQVPELALQACNRDPLLADSCPRRVPRTTTVASWDIEGDADTSVLGFGASAPYEQGALSRNRPPRFLHLQVYTGDVSEDFPAFKSRNHRDAGFRDSLLEDGGEWFSFGVFSWAGREGELFLGPSGGGANGGHLVFRWEDEGIDRVVSLHAWAPLTEARDVLRSIVGSME